MSFGKRTDTIGYRALPGARTAQPAVTEAPERRGGYWWGLLTTATTALVFGSLMAFVPLFNPTARTFTDVFIAVATAAVPSVVFGAAIMFLLVDLLLKAIRQRKAWLYAALSAFPATLITALIAVLGDGTLRYVLAFVVVLPGLLGGWVLGRSRERG